jgi:hypothetical protein
MMKIKFCKNQRNKNSERKRVRLKLGERVDERERGEGKKKKRADMCNKSKSFRNKLFAKQNKSLPGLITNNKKAQIKIQLLLFEKQQPTHRSCSLSLSL